MLGGVPCSNHHWSNNHLKLAILRTGKSSRSNHHWSNNHLNLCKNKKLDIAVYSHSIKLLYFRVSSNYSIKIRQYSIFLSHFCTNIKKTVLKLKFKTAYFNIFLLFIVLLIYTIYIYANSTFLNDQQRSDHNESWGDSLPDRL